MLDELLKLFGNVGIFDEYHTYKNKTPYKLYKMKSGVYKIKFDNQFIDFYTYDKEDAKKYFVFLCKRYLGE